MTGQRAATVMASIYTKQPSFTAAEIDELIAAGLVVEANPDDLAKLEWLQPIVVELAEVQLGDPSAVTTLTVKLHEAEEDLRSDWYRMKSSKAKIAAREEQRRKMRRALGVLKEPATHDRLTKLVRQTAVLAPGAMYCALPSLGSELYALTQKGARVMQQLQTRLDRYGAQPFKAFMHAHAKTEAKMQAFSGDIATLAGNIGYVKKNPHQVVIGLAKTGMPAQQALGSYHAALNATRAPDVAVTVARNTQADPRQTAGRLRHAQGLLQGRRFHTPNALGMAKTLLPFEPMEIGLQRLEEIVRRLSDAYGHDEGIYKLVVRLMPANGTPAEVVQRVLSAAALLGRMPSDVSTQLNVVPAATALAAMARTQDALPALVARFRALEQELVRHKISSPDMCETDALECLGCPGTPSEVADTVASLLAQLAAGRRATRGDVAIAVAFAKRFAY